MCLRFYHSKSSAKYEDNCNHNRGGITINITPAPKISKLLTYDVNMRQEVIFEGERLDTPEIQISGEEGVMYNQQSNRVSGGVMQGTTGFKDITLKLFHNRVMGGK